MSAPILLIIVAMLSIQIGASIAKGLFLTVGPYGVSALRLLLATLVLWITFRPWKTKLTKKQLKALIIYGVNLGLMNLFFYAAIERIPLGIAVALEFTGPLAVAIFSSKNKKDYLWAVLAGIGIYLLLPKWGVSDSLDLLGVLLALAAGAFWAGYILFGKSAGSDVPGGIAASWGMLFAAIVVFPIGLTFASGNIFAGNVLLLGLGVAILSSALPYSLEMLAMKKIPTKTFGILMSLEPAVAALAGLLILHEQLTVSQWLAIGLVMVASSGSAAFSQEKKSLPEVPNAN